LSDSDDSPVKAAPKSRLKQRRALSSSEEEDQHEQIAEEMEVKENVANKANAASGKANDASKSVKKKVKVNLTSFEAPEEDEEEEQLLSLKNSTPSPVAKRRKSSEKKPSPKAKKAKKQVEPEEQEDANEERGEEKEEAKKESSKAAKKKASPKTTKKKASPKEGKEKASPKEAKGKASPKEGKGEASPKEAKKKASPRRGKKTEAQVKQEVEEKEEERKEDQERDEEEEQENQNMEEEANPPPTKKISSFFTKMSSKKGTSGLKEAKGDEEVDQQKQQLPFGEALRNKRFHPIEDAPWKKGEAVPYLALANTLAAIEETSGRLKTVEILANFFRSVMLLTPKDLLASVYLCLNKVAPAYAGVELGVGETLLMRAVANTTGRTLGQVKTDTQKTGDLGIVAEVSKRSLVQMFKPKPLTVEVGYERLKGIALMAGHSVMSMKVQRIQQMLVACREHEARFLIRSLGGTQFYLLTNQLK